MRILKIGFTIIICTLLISCTNDEIVTSNNNTAGKNQTLFMSLNQPQQPLIKGGLFWENGSGSNVTEFYPYGWRGIGMRGEWALVSPPKPTCQPTWNAANNAGYSTKYAEIYRDYLVADNRVMIHGLIDLARTNNAQWIFIDDFLTYYVTGQGGTITPAAINDLCAYAHKDPPYQNLSGARLDVAVSEDCNSVYIWGHIENNWTSLYSNIDIIMPYGYARMANNIQNQPEFMYNHLYNFYNYLKNTKYKRVVPWLGYKTEAGPNYDQLGSDSNSDNFDFIGRALLFADQQMIFFYTDGSVDDRRNLTDYLQTHGYITGTPVL